MCQGDTCCLQFIEAFQHGITQYDTHLELDTERFEGAQKHFTRGQRVKPACIENKFDAARNGYRKEIEQHGREVAGIAEVGVALAILLEDLQCQFCQVVGGDILHIATLNPGLDWLPGIAIEAETSGYANGFHGLPTSCLIILWQSTTGEFRLCRPQFRQAWHSSTSFQPRSRSGSPTHHESAGLHQRHPWPHAPGTGGQRQLLYFHVYPASPAP